MLGQSYFQLISPLIFLVFSCGFTVLRHYAREIRGPGFLAISYLLGSLAFVGDFLRDTVNPDVALIGINLLHLATMVTFCAGLESFYRGRVRWAPLLAIAAFDIGMMLWFRFGHDDIGLRIWAMNIGVIALAAFSVYGLRNELRRLVDRILVTALLSSALLLMARTVLVLWLDPDLTLQTYPGSMAAISLHFCIAIAALAMACILFVMCGMEIVANLTETSRTDPMTGALNRRGLDARLAALPDAVRGTSHAIVLADIDRFKSVNDRQGHEAGDRVISLFARTLMSLARDGDFVVRWGGEEFMVVMPGADLTLARLYAEAARAAFESSGRECTGGEIVTASFGVAPWHGGTPHADAAHMADRALYRAKRSGRNRVSVHRSEPAELAGAAGGATAA